MKKLIALTLLLATAAYGQNFFTDAASVTLASTTETTIVAGISGVRTVIGSIEVRNFSTTDRVTITLRSGTGGLVVRNIDVPFSASTTAGSYRFFIHNFPGDGVVSKAANQNWTVQAAGSGTINVTVLVNYRTLK